MIQLATQTGAGTTTGAELVTAAYRHFAPVVEVSGSASGSWAIQAQTPGGTWINFWSDSIPATSSAFLSNAGTYSIGSLRGVVTVTTGSGTTTVFLSVGA